MKKLLVLLMLGAGFSAYAAGLLQVTQLGTEYVAAKCFPSGHICNGLAEYDSCKCEWGDNVLYFGRFGASADWTTADLDKITDYTATFVLNEGTDSHLMGNGKVWKLLQNSYYTDTDDQNCNVYGAPDNYMACDWTND